ncbi:SDR family NAD(P)-dependent oxidoreductase [Nitrospirillum bahiense]|uniref:NAD(P)-dependent dehydrogenase (Short-subunit alcohol dehydrogenase family) n=1 Tax=Nitrospirillum amazonense TaxID=28077 RepID=A0A560FVI2_9PROT|nr:SDR family NAD(P)-dependent oxidoreductase [Nitrospirillum amazonense]TWB25656.1 NAD(P)-dependent dehydrogenase (short-subunit alcohol dehydrogenase family) [Nitrospirillum amazonense]
MPVGKVAVVTGASRGAGAGIARALGAAGYTVYVTGRTTVEGAAALPGTIGAVAAEVTAAGGIGIPVAVDHGDDDQVASLFDRVRNDQGRLDILVNNATALHDALTSPGGFWERPRELADILTVGLRSHYVASYHAAPLMIATGGGLITFTSSFGSVCYMHGPAYGAQKAGVDKFAADMGVDLAPYGVATLSLWMGPLLTARTARTLEQRPDQYASFMEQAETPEFTGRLIAAVHADPNRMELSGSTQIGAELAARYGIRDAGGKQPPSYRDMLGSPRIPHPAIVR